MRIRLRGAKVSAELQESNDQLTCRKTLAAFAGVMLLYIWAFTHLAPSIGLPDPASVLGNVAEQVGYEFDSDGNVDSHLYVEQTYHFTNDTERLVLFLVITGAFVSGYFLPLRHKRPAYAAWACLGLGVLFGIAVVGTMLATFAAVYLVMHGGAARSTDTDRAALILGVVSGWLIGRLVVEPALVPILAVSSAVMVPGLFRFVLQPFLQSERTSVGWLRLMVPHLALLTVYAGIGANAMTGSEWKIPLGLLLVMFQWARLITYGIDFKDGEVPRDLGLFEFLSVFLSPAVIPNHHYAPYLAQGYTYLNSNFYKENKNLLIAAGLRIWMVALFYLVFADYAVEWFQDYMDERWGVRVYAFISVMVRAYVRGEEMSTPSVLLSTLLDQWRIFLIYGAVTHFKVGTWRVLGYRVDPQYNRPWMATNLATLWSRFAFHYREFLVRAIYYPVFFRFFKRRMVLRIFFAIMIATILGNPFWGHTPGKLLVTGISWEDFFRLVLRSWPYYVLLGLGISLSQLYLMRRVRTRQPWTADKRFVLDIACSYLTFQYFSLIHIFIRPQTNSTLMDHVRLFLIGFGIHL